MSILYPQKLLIQRHFQRAKSFKAGKHLERIYFQQGKLSYNNILTQTICLGNSVKKTHGIEGRVRERTFSCASYSGDARAAHSGARRIL